MANTRLQLLRPAMAMFDVEDRFARDRGLRGEHPRPVSVVSYYLVGRINNGTRDDYAIPQQLVTVRNPEGYDLFFGKIRIKGTLYNHYDLEQGKYVIKIKSSPYQSVELTDVQLPDSTTPISIDLEPGFNYPFPTASLPNGGGPTLLRGTVHAIDGSGVSDIKVQVSGSSNEYITDETGQWVLVFDEDQPSGDVSVRFDLPNGTTVHVASVAIVRGQQTSLGQAGLRGRVVNSAGIGLPNATIKVSGHTGLVSSAHDGRWYYYFGLNQGLDLVNITATLPTGIHLTQSNIQVQPQKIVDVPVFQFS